MNESLEKHSIETLKAAFNTLSKQRQGLIGTFKQYLIKKELDKREPVNPS